MRNVEAVVLVDLTDAAEDFGLMSGWCSPAVVVDAFEIGLLGTEGFETLGLIDTSPESEMVPGTGVVIELGVSLESGLGPAVNLRFGDVVTVDLVERVLRATDLTDAADDLTVSGCLARWRTLGRRECALMLSVSSTLLTIDLTPLRVGVVLGVGVSGLKKSSMGTSSSTHSPRP